MRETKKERGETTAEQKDAGRERKRGADEIEEGVADEEKERMCSWIEKHRTRGGTQRRIRRRISEWRIGRACEKEERDVHKNGE